MNITKEQFKDVQFLTAFEKYQIAKHFNRFVKNGFQRKDFNKRVYEHLHLHCSFIAHYSIDGFYETYFNGSKLDLKRFSSHFIDFDSLPNEDKYNNGTLNYEPYRDINKVMADILIENNIFEKVK